MPVKTLTKFLDDNKVKYVTIRHSVAYTAQQIAQSAHIPGDELAKTVMVKLDGRLAMAVLRNSPRRYSSRGCFQASRSARCRPSAIFTICPSTSMKG
jgi:prolyl-tRNA editing enzyme YbaK/EbsC (Cys-tRNA(Pro) deacylase)